MNDDQPENQVLAYVAGGIRDPGTLNGLCQGILDSLTRHCRYYGDLEDSSPQPSLAEICLGELSCGSTTHGTLRRRKY